MNFFSSIKWDKLAELVQRKKYYDLTPSDWAEIYRILKREYCVIVTRRENHFTTYLIGIGHFLKTGKWGFYTHAFYNVESHVVTAEDIIFLEATSKGVHTSKFWDVFDCDAVCLLRPEGYMPHELEAAFEGSTSVFEGKSYDHLHSIKNNEAMNCVETVRQALINYDSEKYFSRMKNFEAWIAKEKTLTPQMFRDCPDFKVILEIRR